MMWFTTDELGIHRHEGVRDVTPIDVQAPRELSNPPCNVTRHGPPPSPHGDHGRGGVTSPPRRDVGRYSAFTGIIVPFAAGVFGSVTTSTPFLNVAVTLLPSTAMGSRTLRRNAP